MIRHFVNGGAGKKRFTLQIWLIFEEWIKRNEWAVFSIPSAKNYNLTGWFFLGRWMYEEQTLYVTVTPVGVTISGYCHYSRSVTLTGVTVSEEVYMCTITITFSSGNKSFLASKKHWLWSHIPVWRRSASTCRTWRTWTARRTPRRCSRGRRIWGTPAIWKLSSFPAHNLNEIYLFLISGRDSPVRGCSRPRRHRRFPHYYCRRRRLCWGGIQYTFKTSRRSNLQTKIMYVWTTDSTDILIFVVIMWEGFRDVRALNCAPESPDGRLIAPSTAAHVGRAHYRESGESPLP